MQSKDIPLVDKTSACHACRSSPELPEISFAFQPIVDVEKRNIYAFEALVRGAAGEPAASVLSCLTDETRYAFDQRCRQIAIQSAAQAKIDTFLSINFLPNAVYRPDVCIRTTLEAAEKHQFPLTHIIFETVESERLIDNQKLLDIFRAYQRYGFLTAIDDFGAGHSGLTLLSEFQPDIVKIDMALIRGIETSKAKHSIVKGIVAICRDLGIACIAEGIESQAERDTLADLGISKMQGYWFSKPIWGNTALNTLSLFG